MVSEHTAEPIVSGPGWAIRRVGPWVLGHWNEPLNELRVIECRKLYRDAREAHGRFQVLAVFRGPPFELDLLRADRTRKLVKALLEECSGSVDALIYPLEGSGMTGSIMRTGAASVVRLVRMRLPVYFPSTLEQGIETARELRLFDERASEARIRALMSELETLAR